MDLLSGDSEFSESESNLSQHENKARLFEILSDSRPFSREELELLVEYQLGRDPEDIASDSVNKSTFADELIGYCERNGRLTELLSAMRKAKPNNDQILSLSQAVGLPEPTSTKESERGAAAAGTSSGLTEPSSPPPSGTPPAAGQSGSGSNGSNNNNNETKAVPFWRDRDNMVAIIVAIIGLVGTLAGIFIPLWLNNRNPEPVATPIVIVSSETPTETPLPSSTFTPNPPTATPTIAPPSNTPTRTPLPSNTPTSRPPTETPTLTPLPSNTFTPRPPTATQTPIPPTVNPIVTHRVQVNEHLSCISENYYGSKTVITILCGFNQELGFIGDGADNPDVDPCSVIRSGQILHIPYDPTRIVPAITLPPHTPNACPSIPTVTSTSTPTLIPSPTFTETPSPSPSATSTPTQTQAPTSSPTPQVSSTATAESNTGSTPAPTVTLILENKPTIPAITHVVAPNDNLNCIAGFYYGNEALFPELCAVNISIIDQCPNIQIGMELRIPETLNGFQLLPPEGRVETCELDTPTPSP